MLWVVVVAALGASTAGAQDSTPAIGWDVPCGEPAGFVAAVVGLGGSFDSVRVEVAVAAVDGGAFHGRLTIRRGDAAPEVRELDDARCEDVVDALAIAAALALRSPAPAPPPVEPTPPPVEPTPPRVEPTPPPVELTPPPRDEPARVGLGVSLRVGLGPVPGPALAPGLVLALQLDRLWGALSLSYWPDAGATLDDGARGVALWALGTTIEIGYRIGREISVVPCAVVETSAAFARGTGVERPREETTFAFDAGLAVWLGIDLGERVRLFARGDLLFGLARPTYGVDAEIVFEGPVVRGTGGAGVLVLF